MKKENNENNKKKRDCLPPRYQLLLQQLGRGKQNSITIENIIKKTNGSLNRRDIQAIKHDLIMNWGYLIGGSRFGKERGLYLIDTEEDLAHALKPLENEANTTLKVHRKLIENFQKAE
jgi:hypothetical protein